MKKFSLIFISLVLLSFAGSVLAAKEAKEIRHCGCVYDSLLGADMVFHDIFVAGNSQGHRNHVAESDPEAADACFAGLDADELPTYELWTRDEADCMLSGANAGLVDCEEQVEFARCGSQVIDG